MATSSKWASDFVLQHNSSECTFSYEVCVVVEEEEEEGAIYRRQKLSLKWFTRMCMYKGDLKPMELAFVRRLLLSLTKIDSTFSTLFEVVLLLPSVSGAWRALERKGRRFQLELKLIKRVCVCV